MAKLTQIMGSGSGVKELEQCPPEFHFELTQEELHLLIRDPDTAARLMGMEPRISSIEILVRRQADAGKAARGQDIYCCRTWGDKLL